MKFIEKYTLKNFCEIIGLDLVLRKNKNILIFGIDTILSAKSNDISFITDSFYEKYILYSKAIAFVAKEYYVNKHKNINFLVSLNPKFSLLKILDLCIDFTINKNKKFNNKIISDNVNINDNCSIGNNVQIGRNTIIESNVIIENNCKIGSFCFLKSGVVLYNNIKLGHRCIINSNSTIGSDGFGFISYKKYWLKLYHLGGVFICDFIDIGSNSSIDKGLFNDTFINSGVIIDNQVQIAHNTKIGKNTVIAGCVGIAGSVKIGENCMIGGGCMISNNIVIGDNIFLTGASNVTKSLSKSGTYSSAFLIRDNKKWNKNMVYFYRLYELFK